MRKRGQTSSGSLVAADIVPDTRLDLLPDDEAVDRLGHATVAARVAELLVRGRGSVNVALFAPWGAGKSSFFSLLKDAIANVDGGATIIRYDAWRTSGENFQTHFLSNVWEALEGSEKKPPRSLYNTSKTVRLDPIRALKAHGKLLGLIAAWTLLAWLAIALLHTGSRYIGENDPAEFLPMYFEDLQTWFGRFLAAALAVVVAIKLVDLTKVTIDEEAPSRSEQFSEIFRSYVQRVKSKPLVIFVDELDRCSPQQVLDVLSGLRTFLETKGCSFVVAGDRDAISQAIATDAQHPRPVREDAPYYSTPGEFIDKIFQHQVSLPPARNYTLRTFANDLVRDAGGIWEELRHASDPDLFSRVLLTLTPVHVQSPRRVKVLLNTYAMTVRIAQSRGIENWIERADEIAFWSTLRVEFPAFANDLQRVPNLIELVLDPSARPREAIAELVEAWRFPERANRAARTADVVIAGEGAGPLSELSTSEEDGDDAADDQSEQVAISGADLRPDSSAIKRTASDRAATVLNEQLLSYLRRTTERVKTPAQDLVLMLEKSEELDISEPRLVAALELAVDREAGWVAKTFEPELPSVKQAAVRRLANRVYEAADRTDREPNLRELALIAEQLQLGDVAPVAEEALTATRYSLAHGTRINATMAPGLLRCASGRDTDIANLALQAIDEAPHPGLVASRAAQDLDADAATGRRLLIAAAKPGESIEHVLSIAEALPLPALNTLAQDASTAAALAEAFARPQVPAKPDVTRLAQNAANAATAKWRQDSETAREVAEQSSTWALSLFEEAWAVENREDADRDRALMSLVAEFSSVALWKSTFSSHHPVLVKHILGAPERLLPEVRNRLLLVLSQRVRHETGTLISALDDGSPLRAEAAITWGKTMVSQVLEEKWDADIAEQIVKSGVTVRSNTDDPGQLDVVVEDYDRFADVSTWEDPSVDRHLAALRFLAAFASGPALATTSAAANMVAAHREGSVEVRQRLRPAIDAMPVELVAQILSSDALEAMPSSDRREEILLRLACEERIRRGIGEGNEPESPIESMHLVTSAQILSLDEGDQDGDVVGGWIRVRDNWPEAQEVYRESASWPDVDSLRLFAGKLSAQDRADCFAWTALHDRAPKELLQVLGAGSVDVTRLGDVWANLRAEKSSHEQRARDVNRLMCLSAASAGVVDLWLEAFGALDSLHRGVDMNLAAELALRIDSALSKRDPRRVALTRKMTSWVNDQSNSHLTAKNRRALTKAGLLSAAETSTLGDVVRRVTRGSSA